MIKPSAHKCLPEQPFQAPSILGLDYQTATEISRSFYCDAPLHSDDSVDRWVASQLDSPRLTSHPIPLAAMRKWQIDATTGNIRHDSGRFFTITGVKARHRTVTGELEWDQPIIDQPEVGILGILTKRFNGVLHFCLQAKEEPGNRNSVQLSPTVQATYSNYTCAHGGKQPPFVQHFLSPPRERIIFAKLQTEDGGRFLYKSNRNMIVRVDEDQLPDLPEGFIWLTLRQIGRLLRQSDLIHACTRSILAPLFQFSTRHHPTNTNLGTVRRHPRLFSEAADLLAETIQWLDDQRAMQHILVQRCDLNSLQEWAVNREGFYAHREERFFKIIGLDVTAAGREVGSWSQPVLSNPEHGVIGLLMTEQAGKRFFLMQAKAEVGNRNTVQLGPTVQFTPGNYTDNTRLHKPFLYDEFTGAGHFSVLAESLQSEEGARFYLESHWHRILLLPPETCIEAPEGFRWLAEAEISFFLNLGETVNSCARSVLACLL
ncbi:MAG TPA: NDP-hexose 2,3-dehydratase family protein [Geobacteraceae bacterium]